VSLPAQLLTALLRCCDLARMPRQGVVMNTMHQRCASCLGLLGALHPARIRLPQGGPASLSQNEQEVLAEALTHILRILRTAQHLVLVELCIYVLHRLMSHPVMGACFQNCGCQQCGLVGEGTCSGAPCTAAMQCGAPVQAVRQCSTALLCPACRSRPVCAGDAERVGPPAGGAACLQHRPHLALSACSAHPAGLHHPAQAQLPPLATPLAAAAAGALPCRCGSPWALRDACDGAGDACDGVACMQAACAPFWTLSALRRATTSRSCSSCCHTLCWAR
jgi:hypothetical protein